MVPKSVWGVFAVASFTLLLMGTTIFPVSAQNVFQVTLHAVDANNLPVSYPVLFAVSGFGNVTAYQHGTLTLNIPPGQYHASAFISGVLVGDSDLTVNGAMDVVIPTRVYTLRVTVTGVPGNVSGNGVVYAFFGANGFANTSLSGGAANFSQLPAGFVSLLAARPDGSPLATGRMTVGQNDELTLYYSKFFQVSVQVVDVDEAPVPGASITLGLLTAATDFNGTASIFVPSGSVPVQVTFRGRPVYGDSITVLSSAALQLKVNIAPLQVLLVDELGQPLAERAIAVTAGNWSSSVRTDVKGYLAVDQLPYGTITLRVLPSGIGSSVGFPLPQTVGSIQLFTGPLVVQAEALDAVMFGSMRVKVTVRVGALSVKNATVFVDGRLASVGADGTLAVPVGFEWQPKATVTVKAYGVTRSITVSASASPIPLLTFPLALLPVVTWRLLLVRYKRRRVPLV